MLTHDGLMGCYRGFLPCICQRVTSSLVTNHLNSNYQPNWDKDCPAGKSRRSLLTLRLNSSSLLPPSNMDIIKMTGWRMFTVSISTLVSHPFYVISVRMVAQFVGRESNYMYVRYFNFIQG